MSVVQLGDLMATKVPSLNPAQFTEETFELWSIPAFDAGSPEKTLGKEIGSAKKVIQPNDVLLARIVPHIRRAWVVTPSADGLRQIGSGEWIVFRNKQVYPNYLRHFLISDVFHAQFMQTVAGVGGSLLRARPEGVKEIAFFLPPLDEQTRIAAILDQADELRRKRQRTIDRLNQLGQAIFHEMFGDASSSVGWQHQCQKMLKVCKKVTDGTHQAPKWAEKGVPFIFVSNVREHRIDLETKKFVSREEFEKLTKHAKIDDGDVLYTCVGSYGHTAVVSGEPDFVFQRHIAHLKPNHDLIDSHYLSWCLETPKVKQQADNLATGIAQKTVTLSALKSFEIPVPPLMLQKEFAQRVLEIEKLRSTYEIGLIVIQSMFTSLQHRAFRGEL